VQVATERADVVDADLVAHRLDHVEVGMRAALDARPLADQLRREGDRRRPLADAARTEEQIRVRGSFRDRGAEEALGLGLLRKGLEDVHESPLRSRRQSGRRPQR
jgi:hypothetical protein